MKRWGIFALLALVLTAAGAWVGLHFDRREFQSEFKCVGRLQRAAVKPVFVLQEPQTKAESSSLTRIQNEAAMIGSSRVIEMAVEDPLWAKWKSPLPAGFSSSLKSKLHVTTAGDVVEVSIADPDKTLAVTGVKSILSAYVRLRDQDVAQSHDARLMLLRDRRALLEKQVQSRRQQVLDIAKVYGTDDLLERQQFETERVNKLDARLDEMSHSGDAAQPSYQSMLAMRDGLRLKADSIGSDRLKIESLRKECDETQAELDETTRRIDQLHLQSQMDARLMVISDGDLSEDRTSTTQHTMSALGGAGGLLIALLLAMVSGSKVQAGK